ncbi:MAG: glycine cleavage system protein T, partial [Pseudomonadota bacterium]
MSDGSLLQTPFDAMHRAAGAKMGAFAGYDMPIQYQAGVMKEHLHTRTAAGLFDVSHMGQAILRTKTETIGTPEAHQAVSAALETLAPAEYQRLKRGRLRYSVLLNDAGGIMDDFITTRFPSQESDGELFLVVNAGCKQNDFSHIADKLGDQASLEVLSDRVLLALQGPEAARVIGDIFPDADKQPFMSMSTAGWRGAEVYVSRCGYTGEYGFEVSLPASLGDEFAERLLSDTKVEWIGLGARDSLRLEAGLCLYGHDL